MIAHLRIFSTTMSRKPFCADPGQGSDWAFCVTRSAVSDSAIPWTVPCRALLSTGFPRQEYCCGLPFPPPGDLPDPVVEPMSPSLQADALPSELGGGRLDLTRQNFPIAKVLKAGYLHLYRENQGMGLFFFHYLLQVRLKLDILFVKW